MKNIAVTNFLSKLKLSHLFFIALCVRLIALYVIPNPDFPDASSYHLAGVALFNGGHFNDKVMPLYPILSLLTGGAWKLKLLDCFLSALTVVLIYKISFQIFLNHSNAILAAIIATIYPYFIFYAISGLTETSFIFFLCLAYYLFYTKRYFLACIISVITILIRPINDLLNPLLLLTFILLVHREHWKIAAKYLFTYGLTYIVIMSPWWVYNYHRYHTFVRTNLGTGIVLYSGNNPMNHSGGGIGGIDVDANPFNTIKDPIQRNQALIQAGTHYALQHPLSTLKLDAIKFLRFWRLYPYTPKYKNTATIIISLLSYGVILLLCIIYLLKYAKKDFRKISPILLFSFYLMSACMLGIASLRYRLPIEPFMIVLASDVLNKCIRWLEKQHSNYAINSA